MLNKWNLKYKVSRQPHIINILVFLFCFHDLNEIVIFNTHFSSLTLPPCATAEAIYLYSIKNWLGQFCLTFLNVTINDLIINNTYKLTKDIECVFSINLDCTKLENIHIIYSVIHCLNGIWIFKDKNIYLIFNVYIPKIKYTFLKIYIS